MPALAPVVREPVAGLVEAVLVDELVESELVGELVGELSDEVVDELVELQEPNSDWHPVSQ
ncbi:hypothetical protein QX201_007555 [Fusarium graminearum]